MKKYLLFLLIFSLVGCNKTEVKVEPSQIENTSKDMLEKIPEAIQTEILPASTDQILSHVNTLCKKPRQKGTEEEQLAAAYLQKQLTDYGYSVLNQTFDVYRQTLETEAIQGYFNLNPYNEEPQCQATNIIARKEAKEPTLETLVISAHYDTTKHSLGVWDNGSGTCVVLETARLLKDTSLPFNIEFVFFSSEEYYLQGSKYYLTQLDDVQKDNIIGCINVDMVGDGNLEDIIIGTSHGLMNSLAHRMTHLAKEEYKLDIAREMGKSDNFSFLMMGIPSVLISDSSIINRWSTPDDPFGMPLEALNTQKIAYASDSLAHMIQSLDMDFSVTSNQLSNTLSLEDLDKRKIPTYTEEIEKGLLGYELVEIQEQLLSNGVDSSLVFTFKNAEEDMYQVTQVETNSISDINLESFDKVEEKMWVKQEDSSTQILFDYPPLLVYITGRFTQEQIDQFINMFD